MAIYHLGWQSVVKTVPGAPTVPVGTTPLYSSGAGYSGVNGTFTYVSGSQYKREFYTTYINFYNGEWIFTNSTNSTRTYYNSSGDANNIPLTGWESGGAALPPPTISTTAP